MPVKKRILLLFNGPHLAYSPTTLQLHQFLSQRYDVTILAQHPRDYNQYKAKLPGVVYHQYYGVKGRKFYKLLFWLLTFVSKEARLFRRNGLDFRDYFFKFRFIKRHLQRNTYFRILANDLANLFFCSHLGLPADFLSLELTQHEQLLPLINLKLVTSVMIQSQERYDYLFKGEKLPIFFVQNAPVYKPFDPPTARSGIMFAGAAIDDLGFFHCLDFLEATPEETMTLQGAFLKQSEEIVSKKYGRLLANGQLTINDRYLSDDALASYLQTFEVGFCFYNFDNPTVQARYFNYATAPSGKMFKYMAAGLPVIASNIPGFRFVKERDCGVLVDDLQPATLQKAILQVRNNHSLYSKNAVEVAKYFSFDQRVAPYLQMLANAEEMTATNAS